MNQKLFKALPILLAVGLFSCTNAELEPIPPVPTYNDDKLAISGELCTLEPETLVFPLRVIFVVDSSVSMEANDPPDPVTGITGRERAVRETWETMLDQSAEGIKFSVIRFSAQAQPQTGVDLDGDSLADTYFTGDRVILDAATTSLGVTDRTTNYLNAIGEAYFEIRTELIQAEQESLPLSKYVVIFLSDGEPDTDSSDARENSREEILTAVRQLKELTENFRVGSFAFHTAFIASGQAASDQSASSLLQAMAETGDGTFRSFPSGEELNFLFVDFTVLRRVFTLRSLGVYNMNAAMDVDQIPAPPEVPDLDMGMDMQIEDMGPDAGMETEVVEPPPVLDGLALTSPDIPRRMFVDSNGSGFLECGEPMADTDGDGLSDVVEIRLGLNPLLRDTDDDGLNDYLEWQFRDDGLDPLEYTASGCFIPSPCVDADADGYCDCILDSDADGVCDCVADNSCLDALGHDCLDLDEDQLCDCPDLDQDGFCDYADRDGDGLHDCEEVYYGTSQLGVDSDADGIPDNIEVKFQTNPAEDDTQGDLDADGETNRVEVLTNTNPRCADTSLRSRNAYRYDLVNTGIEGSQSCYTFDISNVTLVPTIEVESEGYPGSGWNRIYIYAGEVAFDDPTAFAKYRMACVYASYNPNGDYKNPPSGRVNLRESDFVEVGDFDPEIHCKYP